MHRMLLYINDKIINKKNKQLKIRLVDMYMFRIYRYIFIYRYGVGQY